MLASAEVVSWGVIIGLSMSTRCFTMFCSLRNIVRRVGSVGCAVNTGSMYRELISVCKSSALMPDAFSLTSVSSGPPG